MILLLAPHPFFSSLSPLNNPIPFFSLLTQMMAMIPGFNSSMMPQGNDSNSQMMIKRYITIIESMTDKEMDISNVKIFAEPSRVSRLSRGSGRPPHVSFAESCNRKPMN